MTDNAKMGLNATWAMAVGGMVGGGIFSVLGVIIQLAGKDAWASFIIAGLIAMATGFSYVRLAAKFGQGGGVYLYLQKFKHEKFASLLAKLLIAGYVLTLSVYAFTFGHYLGAVLDFGPLFERAMAVLIVAILALVNLAGVGESARTEEVTVWVKLILLCALGIIGLIHFSPDALAYNDVDPGGWHGMLIGAASIFMAYEGFQLLAYDYEDIREPNRLLPKAVFLSIGVVIGVYVLVALGATSLVGASAIVEHKEIALALAGEKAAGSVGKWLMSLAAGFSTASAINATLFATARLSKQVSHDGDLPAFFEKKNSKGIPDRAVITLAAGGAVLAAIGNLDNLVEAASLTFLFTFTMVNILAFQHGEKPGQKYASAFGMVFSGLASITLTGRLMVESPWVFSGFAALIALLVFFENRNAKN